MPTAEDQEENYPLLLIADEDVKKRNFFNKRANGITNGASNIITQWPNVMNTCWISTAFIALLFFITTLMVLSSMSSGLYRLPRCVPSDNPAIDNRTVHIVHSTKNWTAEEVKLLEKILETYEGYNFHITIITGYMPSNDVYPYEPYIIDRNNVYRSKVNNNTGKEGRRSARNVQASSISNNSLRKSVKQSSDSKDDYVPISPRFKQFIYSAGNKTLRDKVYLGQALEDILRKYSSIQLQKLTYKEYFSTTPMHLSWPMLNEELRIFAIRVLELWQYGGISFSLNTLPFKEMLDLPRAMPSKLRKHKHEELDTDEIEIGVANNDNSTNENSTSKYEYTVINTNKKNMDESSDLDVDLRNQFEIKLDNIIEKTRPLFESIRSGVVLTDMKGLHMATKSACHVFFGELLIFLRNSSRLDRVEDVIRRAILVMCRSRAVDRYVCDMMLMS